MDDTLSDRLKRTAGEMAKQLGDAAHTAGERLSEMRDRDRLNQLIRKLKREKDACRVVLADLVVRMLDQQTLVEALLRPEYLRIKEIDQEVAQLERERDAIGRVAAPAGPEETPPPTVVATDIDASTTPSVDEEFPV